MHCGRSGTESCRVSHNAFRVTTGNREHGVKWHETSSRLWGRKEVKKSLTQQLDWKYIQGCIDGGKKVHSDTEIIQNLSQKSRDETFFIWQLGFAAHQESGHCGWLLQIELCHGELTPKNPAPLTQRSYTSVLSNTPVNQSLAATAAMCALNNLSPVYCYTCFKSHFCMWQKKLSEG